MTKDDLESGIRWGIFSAWALVMTCAALSLLIVYWAKDDPIPAPTTNATFICSMNGSPAQFLDKVYTSTDTVYRIDDGQGYVTIPVQNCVMLEAK